MYINRISNAVNFGYNKDLNKKVNQKLQKSDSPYNQYLLNLNTMVNSLEDKTRQIEHTEKNMNVFANYSYMLIRLKPMIAELIDDFYPDLGYSEIENRDYKMEVYNRGLKGSGHWLDTLSDDMDEIVEIKKLINADDSSDTADKSSNVSNKHLKKVDSDSISTKDAVVADESTSKLLEKFVPNEFSPNGLKSLGGMRDVKELLSDKIIFPAMYPEKAKLDAIEYGIKSPRGELLYGPPGCGKTSVIEAIATETGFPLYKLKIGKTGSKYVNETSSNVQKAYEYAAAMAEKYDTPVFLAIDEMESMTSKRRGAGSGEDDKLVSTLLQIIEEARSKNVIIIGATNCFDLIDDAIKSRFDDKIYIGLPDDDTREQVLKIHLMKRTKGVNLANNNDELRKVVEMTKGFSNRDIAILTDKAALIARKDGRRDIKASDYEIPVRENQNMKIKESLYKDNSKQAKIGFEG